MFSTDAQVSLFSSIICHCFNIAGLGISPFVSGRHLWVSILPLIFCNLIGFAQIVSIAYDLGALFLNANNF